MRMDVSGTLMILVGLLVNIGIAIVSVGRAAWLIFLGGLLTFFGWLLVISGLGYWSTVLKDKKARRRAKAGGIPGIPPAEIHPGIQEPKQ